MIDKLNKEFYKQFLKLHSELEKQLETQINELIFGQFEPHLFYQFNSQLRNQLYELKEGKGNHV